MQPQTMGNSASIVDVIDRVLDKGLIINADIRVSLVGVELLEIKIRAAIASFETAAKYGMELPSGTNTKVEAWKSAHTDTENCPQCKKRIPTEELITEGCPWCEWKSEKADRLKTSFKSTKHPIDLKRKISEYETVIGRLTVENEILKKTFDED